MLTLDTKKMKWIPVSLAAKEVGKSQRQIYRYIKARHVSVASFSDSSMTFVDIEELKEYLCERIKCAGCSVVFKRSGKKKYHSLECRMLHYQPERRDNAKRRAE